MEIGTARELGGIPRISRSSDSAQVAHGVYARLFELLDRLGPDDWRAPTVCDGWDVAAMVGHLLGAAKACASPRELARQQWWGRRHAAAFDGNSLDAANHLQVRDHTHLSPAELVAALRATAPLAVRGRMRFPALLRPIRVPIDPGGSTAAGSPTRLGLGHLMDVVYTRDVWLHTIDIARATGVDHPPDREVDGRVVEDVATEWARRHGASVRLDLEGPAGGRFRQGEGGPHLQLDAIDFCRVLSGRAVPGDDLGGVRVVTDDSGAPDLLATRVLF